MSTLLPRRAQQARVIIDTNVWVSGLVFGGNSRRILELFLKGYLTVVVSQELLKELRGVIKQKLPAYQPHLPLLIASIRKDADLVRLGEEALDICRDPADNFVIETALAGNCTHLISGDQDLVSMGHFRQIQIVSPREFLELDV